MNTKKHASAASAQREAQSERMNKVAKMYRAGTKSIDIARILGIAPSTVHHDLLRAGFNLHAIRQQNERKEAERIMELALAGLPAMEVAEVTGFSRAKVDKIAKKYNFGFRRSNAKG
jgi:DNA-binding CsgD family transcriptional regulator